MGMLTEEIYPYDPRRRQKLAARLAVTIAVSVSLSFGSVHALNWDFAHHDVAEEVESCRR